MMSFSPMQIEPAAAGRVDEDDAPWDQCIAERKEDGWRSLMHLHVGDGADGMFITGRNRVDKGLGPFAEWGENVPHLAPSAVPPGLTILDGEIIPPAGVPRRLLAGILGTDNVKKIAAWKAEHGLPVYRVFDILYLDGVDVRSQPLRERLGLLREALRDYFPNHGYVEEVKRVNTDTRGFYGRLIDAGEEGVMLKNLDAPYDGKKAWFKVKRKHDIDVFVTGYTEAKHGKTGKFDGLIGAVEVSVLRDGAPVQVAQVSGMTDDVRREITENRVAFMHRAMTIRAQEFSKDKLAHPRFKEWRPDLDFKACTWDKMMADLAANKGRNVEE